MGLEYKNIERMTQTMKLLVSVINPQEVPIAIKGGAHIIDVKNPTEGTFGANLPHVIRAIRTLTPPEIQISATIGDLPNLPGTAALAALGAAVSGADYVKAGLYDVTTLDDAIQVLTAINRAVKDYNPTCNIIAAGYADYKTIGCIPPQTIVSAAHTVGIEGVLIDIVGKLNHTLFDFLNETELQNLITQAHDAKQLIAFAGGLQLRHISSLKRFKCDIIGIRRAACIIQNGAYQITADNITAFTQAIV